MIDWSGYITLILEGALVTIELTVLGSILALVMAFAAGLGRLSRFFAIRALATTYIEFFRGTSIFVQLFWVYFVLPFAGVNLSPLQAGVLALGLNVGAYGAEVVRGAIRSVPREQHEACVALNLTRYQRMTDMTFQAQVVRAQTGSTLIPFAIILVLYFAMAWTISLFVRWLERRATRNLDGVRV
jgi:polar amino acid transport system permease protein